MSKAGAIVAFFGILAFILLAAGAPWYVLSIVGAPLGWFFSELDDKAGRYERGSK